METAISTPQSAGPERSLLDRFLAVLAPVRAGESATALILAANVFLLLGADRKSTRLNSSHG